MSSCLGNIYSETRVSGEAADQTVEVDKTLAAGTERSLGRLDTVVGFAY